MLFAAAGLMAVLGTADLPSGLKPCGGGRVASIESGDHLTIEGGQAIRMALVMAPRVADPGSPYSSWPHAAESRAALERLAGGQAVSLLCESTRPDRHGALVAHVMKDGEWLQARLVADGDVFAFPDAGEKDRASALQELATAAREARKGLWALDAYQPVPADDAGRMTGRFALVEGRILKAAKAGKTVWLNFGADRTRDFTVEIPARLAERMAAAGTDPLTLSGHSVRVSGFVDWRGGPHILLSHPDQLETLPLK